MFVASCGYLRGSFYWLGPSFQSEGRIQKRTTPNAELNSAAVSHLPQAGYRFFLFPTLISSTAVEQESAERGVPCGSQGEHGGQCYERLPAQQGQSRRGN